GAWLFPVVLWAAALAFAAGFASLRPAVRVPVATLLLASGVLLMPRSAPSSTGLAWRSYSADETSRAGSPAIIDFSADWCLPCRELDEKTFSDPRVRAAMSRRTLF